MIPHFPDPVPLPRSPLPLPVRSPAHRCPLPAQDLVLSEDLKGVRRRVPVPEYDIAGMQRRILVVENLPALPTIGERRSRAMVLENLPALPTIGERRSRARACMTYR